MSIFLNTIGTAYTQNFNTLSNIAGSTNNDLSLLLGWLLNEDSGGNADGRYAVDDGTSNVGNTYSYGAAGSTERALGSLQSGTLIPSFGVFFNNNTGKTITSLDIAYTGEEWRLGTAGRTDQLNLEYRIGGFEGDLTNGTWVSVPALNFTTPDTTTVGAKDGNTVHTALSATISGLNIPVGTIFAIRWTDTDATSNDDGLAVDDFSLTTHSNAAPPVIQNDHANAVESTRLQVDAAHGVLANDTGATIVLSPSLNGFQRTAAGGQIVFGLDSAFHFDGSYQYISAAGFSGTDSVQYATNDGGTGTLFIDVAAKAHVPFVSIGDQVGVRHSVITGFPQIGNGGATTASAPVVLSGGGHVDVITFLSQAPGNAIELRTFDANNNLVSAFDPGVFARSPKVTALPNGGYVFTYGVNTPIDPNDPFGAFNRPDYFQLFDAAGHSLSGPTPVGDVPGAIDDISAVSALPNGGFVVLQLSTVGVDRQLYAQSFSAAGVPESQQYAIGTPDQTGTPAILPNGEIVTTQVLADLHFQRYDTHGTPIGSEIVFAGDAHAIISSVLQIAARPAGGFFVSWETSFGRDANNRPQYATHVQAVDADGHLAGSETTILQSFVSLFGQPHGVVTPLANGGFVLTWRGVVESGIGTFEKSQTYDPNGNAVGAPIKFDSQTTFGAQRNFAFALPDGGFVITVQTAVPTNHDLYVYDNNGTQVGQLRMHDAADGTDASTIFLANLPNGDTLVTAQSFNSFTLGNNQITAQTVHFAGTTPVVQTGEVVKDAAAIVPVKVFIPDPDGSEIVQSIDVSGLPAGWTLDYPHTSATLNGGVWTITGSGIANGGDINLHLAAPLGTVGSATLSVVAHTVDTVNGSQSQSFPASFNVTLSPAPPFQYAGSVDTGPHPAGYQVVGTGDFNHDGTSDVLWRNLTTGQVEEWRIKDGHWDASINLGSRGTGWNVAAIGDFNGDGTSDVLWRDGATGKLDAWIMQNGQWSKSVDLGSHGADWLVVGVGDFNGDHTSDILFRNTAGQVESWQMANGNWSKSNLLGSYNTAWGVGGVGDLDRDGTSDILWRNPTTGQVDEWRMVDGKWAGSTGLGSFNPAYDLVAVDDFNGNGSADVLFRNPTTGQVEGWVMSNGLWAGSVSLGSFNPAWQLAGTGDFNHAGGADALWFNPATGQTGLWLLNGV